MAVKKSKSNEIHITRIYDAPVRMVWEAWTDIKKVAQWWGPRGFTLTSHSKDFRPNGIWHYTMHGPDGVDYPNKTVYLEIEKYSRLVYDHGGYDDRPPLFRVTVLFSETNGKTKMEMSMALATPEEAEKTREFIKKAGGEATWDRLDEYLTKDSNGKEKFCINRTFEAPIATMFKMWTNPEHLIWLAPTGMNMQFIRTDIRSGGSTFFKMTDGGSITYYGRIQYLKIEPTQLVYTQQFCDENEKVSRHPMAPLWPETMLTTVTLSEEAPDRTRVTVNWEVLGNVTPAELAEFVKGRSGMTQGWTGSFDKLEAHLTEF